MKRRALATKPFYAALYTLVISGALLPLDSRAALAADDDGLTLVPFVIDTVRIPAPVAARIFLHNGGDREVRVEEVLISVEGQTVARAGVEADLKPSPEYRELAALIERLPVEFTERHRARSFAAPEAREFVESEVPTASQEIARRLDELRRSIAQTGSLPFLEVPITVPFDQFLADRAPGTVVDLELSARYRRTDGTVASLSVTLPIERLAPFRDPPASLERELGGGLTVHAGDLHVHSCHGESLGACSPSGNCTAESLQVSGSFSFAELKTQYEALGIDWFTATDHSYCINSESEYDTIAAEVAAITDASFVALPDTEVSSDESGPQQGSDLGDLLCFGLTSSSHMGAHGIDSRIFGGDDGLLGFCDGLFSDALESFHHNIEEIRAEGGYPIVHHPDASSWGWNSFDDAQGIEANALHGVEIWNGASVSGQGGDVGVWVDWLLAGRILYAYSGSDTHDEAVDFGANRVLLTGPFDGDALEAALMAGRTFISNEHFLVITATAGSRTLRMGDRQDLPAELPAGTPIELRTHYDVGTDTVTITLFRGRVGDAAETEICSQTVTGSGVLTCSDDVTIDTSSYYRSYSEESVGDRVAYTNPIFLLTPP